MKKCANSVNGICQLYDIECEGMIECQTYTPADEDIA